MDAGLDIMLEHLKALLVSRATGGIITVEDDRVYKQSRDIIFAQGLPEELIPRVLRICHSLDQFWAYIQAECKTYGERRLLIKKEFDPLISWLRDQNIKALFAPSPSEWNGSADTVKQELPTYTVPVTTLSANKEVFLIHGHDMENVHLLKDMLQENWGLKPIRLSSKPSAGRTLIEKFEQEAARSRYAIALLTPDDIISANDESYAQARPNVIFELGWFYGRLGRQNVAVVCRKGIKIHSDLDGINRIEFKNSVSEVFMELQQELCEAGLINLR